MTDSQPGARETQATGHRGARGSQAGIRAGWQGHPSDVRVERRVWERHTEPPGHSRPLGTGHTGACSGLMDLLEP